MKKCSALRDFLQSVDYNESIHSLKSKSIEYIKNSDIYDLDKRRMCIQISQINSVHELSRYLFNALLKFEGMGVI